MTFTMVMLFRRLILALILIFSTDLNKQVFFIQFSSLAFLMYFMYVKPFTCWKYELIWIFNEILTYLSTTYCYVFSNYSRDLNSKWLFGYFFMGSLLLNIVLNIFVLSKFAIQTVKDYVKPKH